MVLAYFFLMYIVSVWNFTEHSSEAGWNPFSVGGLLGPQAVRVSGMAETECASGKPSV